MDITNMLTELRSELHQIDEAILVLQRLATSGAKRRGRPPKWISTMNAGGSSAEPAARKKRVFSLATRKKMALAQRRRWLREKSEAV